MTDDQTTLFGSTDTRKPWQGGPDTDEHIRAAAEDRRRRTLEERFSTFHADNPRVYELLVRFSRQWVASGRAQCGIALIWERMRWEMMLSTTDASGFKLNNDYKSRYARLIMAMEPDLAEFFNIRELRTA